MTHVRSNRTVHAVVSFLTVGTIVGLVGLVGQSSLEAQITSRGFLQPGTLVGDVVYRAVPLADRLCQSAANALRLAPCATTRNGRVPGRNFLPPSVIGAELPHLRVDMVLKRMQNNVVSGLGAGALEPAYAPYFNATFLFSSNAANSDSDPLDAGTQTVIPAPGTLIDIEGGLLLYSAIILNGCSAATNFDLRLVSAVKSDSTDIGQVDLSDAVTGNGYRVFGYTIRATIADHGTSDIVFSGDANFYCTGKPTVP